MEKNHQCLRSTLSWWRHLATILFILFSVVLGSAREMFIFSHQTEVADPHPPAVWWRKAEDRPVLNVVGLLILQLPEGLLVGMLAMGEGGLLSSEPLLEGVWGESNILLGGASGLHNAPVDKVGGLTLPLQQAGLQPTVAVLGLHVGRWSRSLLVVPRDYPGHVGHAAVADLHSASVKVLANAVPRDTNWGPELSI